MRERIFSSFTLEHDKKKLLDLKFSGILLTCFLKRSDFLLRMVFISCCELLPFLGFQKTSSLPRPHELSLFLLTPGQ